MYNQKHSSDVRLLITARVTQCCRQRDFTMKMCMALRSWMYMGVLGHAHNRSWGPISAGFIHFLLHWDVPMCSPECYFLNEDENTASGKYPTSPHMHTQRSLKGKIEGLSTLQGNSLVLNWVSTSAHNFATSKVALIFTSHLKIGNTDLFCSPNAFLRDFDNSTWLKGCSPWNSPQCPCAKWSWSKNYPFIVVLGWNEDSDPPLYLCFLLIKATRKNTFGGKKYG